MNYLANTWRQNPRVAWLTALVLANALLYWVLPIVARFAFDPISLWLSHLGLAACWMAWGDSPIWKRGPAAVSALLLCSFGAWEWMRWENQSWLEFVEFEWPVLAISWFLLHPVRIIFHYVWRLDDPAGSVPPTPWGQFTLRGLMAYAAVICVFLGTSYWFYGEETPGMLGYCGMLSVQSLAGVVPVVGLILASRRRRVWLVALVLTILIRSALELRHILETADLLEWRIWYGPAMFLGCGVYTAVNVAAIRILCPQEPHPRRAEDEGSGS